MCLRIYISLDAVTIRGQPLLTPACASCGIYSRAATIRSAAFIRGNTVIREGKNKDGDEGVKGACCSGQVVGLSAVLLARVGVPVEVRVRPAVSAGDCECERSCVLARTVSRR